MVRSVPVGKLNGAAIYVWWSDCTDELALNAHVTTRSKKENTLEWNKNDHICPTFSAERGRKRAIQIILVLFGRNRQ
jgi:hypothetical protein